MSKIVNFSDLKKANNSEKDKHLYAIKHNDILNLIADKKYSEALSVSEKNFNEYGFVSEICEAFASAVSVNLDAISKDFPKYYKLLKAIHEKFPDDEMIEFFIMATFLNKLKAIIAIEGKNFNYSTFFDEIYQRHTLNHNIVHTYSTYLLNHLDLFNKDEASNNAIFEAVTNRFLLISIDFPDSRQIATEFSKFCYLSSVKSSDKFIIETSYEFLSELKENFDDIDELVSYYCLYLSHHFIKDSSFKSIKAINEFKEIAESHSNFIFREMFFISLYNILAYQEYNDSKYILNEMSLLLYNIPINEREHHQNLVDLYAECLSNFSCESNIKVQVIYSELLPAITKLIDVFGQQTSLVVEYCVILYNISCLVDFYDDEDSPHIDFVNELKNCAKNIDDTIPYYCMTLSNLIHLNNEDFASNVIAEIDAFFTSFDNDSRPSAKNDITFSSIYAMALANAVDVSSIEKSEDYLLKIKELVGAKKNKSLDIQLSPEMDKNILRHYQRAISYYIPKILNDPKIHEYTVILHKLNNYLIE